MGKRQLYTEGEKLGTCFFVKEVERRNSKGERMAEFICGFCGGHFECVTSIVKRKHTTSCGCQGSRNTLGERNFKHGLTKVGAKIISEFRSWTSMRRRCLAPSDDKYPDYGGRGIAICDRWMDEQNGFNNFFSDMGKKPSSEHTIDRKDNDGNYSCGHCEQCVKNGWPTNCRWATPTEQVRNRRLTLRITYKGVTKPAVQWCEELGLNYDMVKCRIRRGWDAESILTQPSSWKKLSDRYVPAKIEYAFGYIG